MRRISNPPFFIFMTHTIDLALRECRVCGRNKVRARGLCNRCYMRWRLGKYPFI